MSGSFRMDAVKGRLPCEPDCGVKFAPITITPSPGISTVSSLNVSCPFSSDRAFRLLSAHTQHPHPHDFATHLDQFRPG